ncbi:unnamed protein product [Schistosoma rodhaini]|uniref:Uncharacterized protein n=1 Tax=Schistosoma rodhaini TaxID=6188 RepID=A0AA85GGU3_9TREM|nr:unnamed protein product [Schistosoma rodhaini]
MVTIVENAEWEGVNVMKPFDRLRVVSTYIKTVLILVAIQISITFVIIMLSSIPEITSGNGQQPIPSIIAVVLGLIALVIALLIVLVKKISEKYPLNAILAIIYVRICNDHFTYICLFSF